MENERRAGLVQGSAGKEALYVGAEKHPERKAELGAEGSASRGDWELEQDSK